MFYLINENMNQQENEPTENEQTSSLIVDVCQKVIFTFASVNKVETHDLILRIDLENQYAKPVFGIFEQSTLLCRPSLKEVIHAGGGQGFALIASVQVRNIIKDIFVLSMERFELTDSKRLFVLLYLKSVNEQNHPCIHRLCKWQ